MAKVIFTPWKTQSQLLSVRSQFYPSPSYTGSDMRSKACATVSNKILWKSILYIYLKKSKKFIKMKDWSTNCSEKVSSWKLRGNLPHAVEATALLTDAILHDDARENSIFSIRATYSAAFCRFVFMAPSLVTFFIQSSSSSSSSSFRCILLMC